MTKTRPLLITALMLLALVAGLAPQAAAAPVSFEEPWDDYNTGFPAYPPIPESARVPDWDYEIRAGTSNTLSMVSTPVLGGQALKEAANSWGTSASSFTQSWQSMKLVMNTVAYPCDGGDSQVLEFDLYLENLLTASVGSSAGSSFSSFSVVAANTADTSIFAIQISADVSGNDNQAVTEGNVDVHVTTSTGAVATLALGVVTADEYWHFTMLGFDCGNERFSVSMKKTADGSSLSAVTVDGVNLAGVMSSPNILETRRIATSSGAGGRAGTIPITYMENIEVAYDGSTAPPPVDSAALASVPELVGFDVDPTGSTMILRTHDAAGNTRDNVRVYAAQTLALTETVETDCSISHGVTTRASHVAYLDCDPADPDDTEHLIIRDNTLGLLDVPECGESDVDFDWTIPDGDPDNDINEIRTFQLYSIDFDQTDPDPDGLQETRCSIDIGLAASTTKGQVGVVALRWQERQEPSFFDVYQYDSDFTQYATSNTNPVDQICNVFATPDAVDGGNGIVGAVDTETPTKFYTWDPGFPDANTNSDDLDADIQDGATAGGAYGSARGLGCGRASNDTVVALIQTATHVRALNLDDLSEHWAPIALTAGVPDLRSATMSLDGEWGAYVDGTQAYVLNMTTGASVCGTITVPTGDLVGIALTERAQSLFVATDAATDNVARYDIHECTTVTAVGETGGFDDNCNPLVDVCTPQPAPDGEPGAGEFGGGAVGGLSEKTAIYLSAATITGFAAVGWAFVGRRRKVG